LTVDISRGILKIKRKNQLIEYLISDIEKAEYYLTYNLVNDRHGWLPWDTYHYLDLYFKNGEYITIPCFVVNYNELVLPIDESKIELIKVFYPLIK
jgi:hypothetical protein